MRRFKIYQTSCNECGEVTTKHYFTDHNGLCKRCYSNLSQSASRNAESQSYGLESREECYGEGGDE